MLSKGKNDKSKLHKRKIVTKNVATIFKDFCQHCSLHGFYYFYKSSSPFVHSVWSAIILSSVVLCGYLGWMIFQKFVVDPTLTVVESIHYPMSEISFPAVTICDPYPVYGPSTGNITKILVYRGYNSTQISEFYSSFTDVKEKGFNPAPYLKKMHELLDDLGYPLNTLLYLVNCTPSETSAKDILISSLKLQLKTSSAIMVKKRPSASWIHSPMRDSVALKKPCEALLVSCVWRSKAHNCSLMFRQEFLISGYCCQFDMDYFQRNADSATTFISGVHITEALQVTVDGTRYQPGENSTEGHVLLYIFDQHDTITFLDNSVTITPSAYFDVNVDVWTIDSSDYVKALSVQSRKCILQSDATYGAGFYHGCMVQNIMRRVVEICRCIPFHYTSTELRVDVKKPCTWDRLICIYDNTDKILGNMKSVIADSECYQRCDYTQYDTEVKYVHGKRRFHDLNRGLSRIMVHFVENTCLKYRREVLYTWDQVLANLGGIFGLCLGGSIISIIELVWFLLDLLFTVTKGCIMKKVAPKKQELVLKMAKNDDKVIGKYKFTH